MINGLDLHNVVSLHAQLKLGSGGYRIGVLEPILKAMQDDEHYPTASDKLALLVVTIVREHPFDDGNKRMAYSLGAMLLLQNGYTMCLQRYAQEMMTIIELVAKGQIKDGLLVELVASIVGGEDDWSEELKTRYILACGDVPDPLETTKALYTPSSQLDDLPTDRPIVFISYSWDSKEHKEWVRKLADDLGSKYGIYVLADFYNRLGEDVVHFMPKGIEASNRVLIIGTPKYKIKSEQRKGGVRYEDHVIRMELYHNMDTLKFIPILREGDFESVFNPFVEPKGGVDFRDEANYEENLRIVAMDILGKPVNARPALGEIPELEDMSEERIVNSEESRVESQELKEQPTLWGKLFRFEDLSNDELDRVICQVCESIRAGRTPSSFVEYSAAVINLCEIHDTMLPLPDADWKSIRWCMQQYLFNCENKEELYMKYEHYHQIRETIRGKGKGPMMKEIDVFFKKTYDDFSQRRKDRMTLLLENMTDVEIGGIFKLHHEGLPDHSCEYSMTGIFQNVDISKVYRAICGLSNVSRGEFADFIEERYLLRHQLTGNCWVAFDEELDALRTLKKKIDENIETFVLNDKRAMQRISENIGKAIQRCSGETRLLIK